MHTTDELDTFSWPVAQLGDALEQLARRAGLKPTGGDPLAVPAVVTGGSASELARWMSWAGERLGIEAEAVDITAGSVDALLAGAGPAVLQFADRRGARVLLLLACRRGKARVLCPDLRVRRCAPEQLRDALCAAHAAPLMGEIDRLLELADVSAARGGRARAVIARERLGTTPIGRSWLLRLPPTTSFWRQLQEERIPMRLCAMFGVFAVTYALEILAWSVIGSAALDGRLDLGWLTGWALLVLSIIPLRLVGSWFDSTLALDVSRLLKTRLLVGALQLDIETVRHQGAGQLLGRVMESQAFESLALNFGLASLVSLIELAFAAAVLGAGAAGTTHLLLLAAWLALAVGLSVRYFRRLGQWAGLRLDLTDSLVERMVGHRTTLAQESAERRDREQDGGIKEYVHASAGLDKSVTPLLAGLPSGWLLVGLAGLVPAFVSGRASAAQLAISVGGVLLASRALTGVASGLTSAAGAVVAWKQIGPLFTAGSRAGVSSPFIATSDMQVDPAAGAAQALVDADSVTYRYGSQAEPVLRNVNLSIRHGEKLLIEGASGGGKSTLASLLVGLRTPDSGMLLLNGLDRFTLGESWHHFATEAPQFHENHVMTGTLGFNLLMGRNWPATDEELDEARTLCGDLGLGDLLERMPSGMMQTVGETGWQLSHGERSRLFLARALLQDAELTVLDESLAALDPESLETCLGTVLRRTKTLAVIAHP